MTRIVAGVMSLVACIAAAIFWWQSREGQAAALPDPPLPVTLLNAPMMEAPMADAKTREEKRFGRYDKDKNNQISLMEYFASRQKAFAKLDVDKDGKLSFDEWTVKGREKFTKADADKSKTLSTAEFATTAPVRKPKAKPKCDCQQVAGKEGDEE